jgi:hypothetical protein
MVGMTSTAGQFRLATGRPFTVDDQRAAYERLGVPSYWVIDPEPPCVIVFELDDGAYEKVAEVEGDHAYEAERPYPVRVVPAALLGAGS